MQGAPYADEVQIAELPLAPGAEVTFIYDIGDWWEFELALDPRAPDDGAVEEPTVLEAGASPHSSTPGR